MSPELLKRGTHSPVPGRVRMNLMILCLLILDHVWSDETLLTMCVLHSVSQNDLLQFMWHTPCVKVNEKLLGYS